jgi:putative transposase
MHNGGAYGEGTTESSVGVEPGAARTTGKHGQFPFASGGTGDSGADRFAERVGKDQPTNCPAVGTDQRDRGQMAATVRGAGVAGLHDELRPGRPRPISDERVARLVRKTSETKPKDGTHWSIRQMAEQTRISKSTVHRIWQIFGLEPHRQRHFKLSTDPFFVEKVRDIVGLYLNPPENAVVLCVDEKSQIQALERTQPMLPIGLGYVEGVTHDYRRHGTTTLFAALDTARGTVITQCRKRHRHQEYLDFLREIDQNVPSKLDVHVVVDNYATHKHPRVKRWLAARPRFHVHFTPTYASWLNQVEIWFNRITQKAIRRGTFRSVKELIEKIDQYVQNSNRHPHPFVWTATADSIFAKVQRLCERI